MMHWFVDADLTVVGGENLPLILGRDPNDRFDGEWLVEL
jgi:hypothetical protein